MNLFLEAVRSALASIRAHRLRSFLTSLGIVIGVASVITVISLIQGLSKSVSDQFEGLGGNGLTIQARNEFKDRMRGKINYLRVEDVDQLRLRVDGIRDLSPFFVPGTSEVRFTGMTATAQVFATSASYQEVNQRFARLGRFISDSDNASARRVAVIGEKLIQELHLPANPVGQFILYGNEWFKVIGVMEKRGEVFGMSQDNYMIIPFKTGQSMIGNNTRPYLAITVAVRDLSTLDETRSRIRAVMRQAHRLKPDERDDFEIESADQIAKSFDKLSATVTLVMSGVVGIALLVGGIGIMNIMLVSVKERTREIGICKAIGARSRDILLQFLIEAVTLSLLGGLLGLAIGYGLGVAIAAMIPDFPPAVVPWWAVALSVLFSGSVGVIFGVVPASQAARLDPIDALRYE
ncbi:Macrolide export ATP-binding/permease protein MacB [Massilia sp. Bi118]|uniref:ABC transporter permease n=1 Tax=Massilia sp. Bi118 TaxID=2822346 RepID=UPI001DC2A709|nr:ABC transporter permease [Massilia sp. Bi118]CAH0202783.1 Macrolide export ATP-binding/permease protein MacB [Massilia sp. Bi118]